MDPSDKWLKGLAAGDADACEWLAREYHVRVYRFLVGLTGDPDQAADLSQDTAVQVWAKVGGCRFASARALSTWVYTVALNVYRQARRRHRPETAVPPYGTAPSGPDPQREAERREEAARVRGAVARLPEPERAALALKAYEGLTYREIARVTGEPVGTVKWRVSRAYGLLRQDLAGRRDEHGSTVREPAGSPGR